MKNPKEWDHYDEHHLMSDLPTTERVHETGDASEPAHPGGSHDETQADSKNLAKSSIDIVG